MDAGGLIGLVVKMTQKFVTDLLDILASLLVLSMRNIVAYELVHLRCLGVRTPTANDLFQ